MFLLVIIVISYSGIGKWPGASPSHSAVMVQDDNFTLWWKSGGSTTTNCGGDVCHDVTNSIVAVASISLFSLSLSLSLFRNKTLLINTVQTQNMQMMSKTYLMLPSGAGD